MGRSRNVWIKSQISEKLDDYITRQHILGRKYTITEVVNYALEDFLDEHRVDDETIQRVLEHRIDSKYRRGIVEQEISQFIEGE